MCCISGTNVLVSSLSSNYCVVCWSFSLLPLALSPPPAAPMPTRPPPLPSRQRQQRWRLRQPTRGRPPSRPTRESSRDRRRTIRIRWPRVSVCFLPLLFVEFWPGTIGGPPAAKGFWWTVRWRGCCSMAICWNPVERKASSWSPTPAPHPRLPLVPLDSLFLWMSFSHVIRPFPHTPLHQCG